MKLIQTQTLATTASSINFTSIPQIYTDLFIIGAVRKDSISSVDNILRFNSDSATNYRIIRFRGTGTSVTYANNQSRDSITGGSPGASDFTSNTFSNFKFYIPNYTSTDPKSVLLDSVTENNSSLSYQEFVAASYVGNSAITSVNLIVSSGGFVAGSTISLYGITEV